MARTDAIFLLMSLSLLMLIVFNQFRFFSLDNKKTLAGSIPVRVLRSTTVNGSHRA